MPYYLCRGCSEFEDEATFEPFDLTKCIGCSQNYCHSCAETTFVKCGVCDDKFCCDCDAYKFLTCWDCSDDVYCGYCPSCCDALTEFNGHDYCPSCLVQTQRLAKEREDKEKVDNLAKEVDEKMVVE